MDDMWDAPETVTRGPRQHVFFLLHSKRCKVYTTNREYSKWVNDATHTPKWPKGNPGTHHRASTPVFYCTLNGVTCILQIGNTQGGGMMRPHAAVAKRDPG